MANDGSVMGTYGPSYDKNYFSIEKDGNYACWGLPYDN